MIFTVEAVADDAAAEGYPINPHGRYSHTRTYLSRAVVAAGLAELAIEPAVLRSENQKPVDGFVVSCMKRGAGRSVLTARFALG